MSERTDHLAGPWVDPIRTDPLRILVNRLRSAAADNKDHLYSVADKLTTLLNKEDARIENDENQR